MGAYLRGEQLEFNKKKFLVRDVHESSKYAVKTMTISTDTFSKYKAIQSDTIIFKLSLDAVYGTKKIDMSDSQKLENVDVSKFYFEGGKVYVGTRSKTTTATGNFLVGLNEVPNLFTVTVYKDEKWLYVKLYANPNIPVQTASDGSNLYVVYIILLLGLLKYDDYYVMGTNTDVFYFANDVASVDGMGYPSSGEYLGFEEQERIQYASVTEVVESGHPLNEVLMALDLYKYKIFFCFGTTSVKSSLLSQAIGDYVSLQDKQLYWEVVNEL